MSMSSHYGSTLCVWAMDNPHPSFTALMASIEVRAKAGESMKDAYQRVSSYEDPRFEYCEGLCTWGGRRFTKSLKPEYRAAFDEWCVASKRGTFDHEGESLWLSMSGITTSGEEGFMFVTLDPKNHPPPQS